MLIWQDIVLASGAIFFFSSLLFSIKSEDKPELKTCVMQVGTRFALLVALVSMEYWITVGATILMGIGWGILLVQQIKRRVNKI